MIGLDFGESKSARPASVVFSFWGGINMAYALITNYRTDICVRGTHTCLENLQSMDSADRTARHFHECFVGRPCGCCAASDLGVLPVISVA
jgi:hypothetical protein